MSNYNHLNSIDDLIIRVKGKYTHSPLMSDRQVVNTLDNFKKIPGRMSGNTTRQVDYAIQALFEGKIVICLDHNEGGENRMSNDRLLRLVLTRLISEHSILGNKYHYDKDLCTIYLKD